MGPDFDGETYDRNEDHNRLTTSIGKVWALMIDGKWRTLSEISQVVGSSEAGVSARLRDLRKPKFKDVYPTLAVNSERQAGGLWMYQVVPAKAKQMEFGFDR